MVAGQPKNLREGDPPRTRRRTGKNFSDLQCRLLVLDFDGLASASPGERLDRPEDFGERAFRETLGRLPAAFNADCLLVATSSTGLPVNAKGKPANGCARFRAIFLLSRPLFFAEQKQIVIALKKLPGLDCLDLAIYSVPQFSFIARPEFPPDMDDPIAKPVIPCEGGQSQVDVDMLLTEIDVEPGPKGRLRTDGTPVRAEDRRLNVAPELRIPLVRQAVEAIVNDLDRVDWVHMAHAIDGSVDGDPAGRDIFLGFTAREEREGKADPYEEGFDEAGETDAPSGGKGPNPEEEAERVWDTRGEGRAGYGYLMQLLEKQGTPEAEAAIFAIQLERAREAFKDSPDDLPDDDPNPSLRIVCPTIFNGLIPPSRRWIAPQWIPYEVVTGFYGDGGVGKSLLAQQLQTATALGSTWIGLPVEQAVSLGVYCEDDENELWRRQCAINASYFADHDALGLTHWMPRLGEDNLLMTFGRSGVGKLTKFHQQVLDAALDLKARLVIIDTAADVFGGNENDRGHVRQFVQRALGGIALKIDGAVVCCAHPSRAGLKSGEGDSGSTGWSNAFRSRLYIRHIEDDPNGRILDRKKANYASRNDELRLRWHDGVIVPGRDRRARGDGDGRPGRRQSRVPRSHTRDE
jgi:AAA domain